jgi:EmrB/QacA subfamily drug resistance transporter
VIDARQRRVGFLVAGCFFMEIMDGTIVSTAAPRLGEALGVPVTSIGLVITAYFVTLAVFIPSSGWLVSRWGTRTIFLSAIVVFTAASLLCSTSTSLGELVAFRVLQAIGGAMMTPVGRLSVLAGTAKSDLMRMISYIVWPALLAPVIAPLAGGVITTYASWRWIFLINVPLGVVAFIVAVRIVPSAAPSAPPPLDLAGVALTALGLGGLAYAAGLISQSATPWALVAAVGLPALLALALAIRHLLRAANPLVDLRTLRIPTFRVAVGSGSLSGMAIGAVPFMLPLLFENVFGWSPVKSGAVVLFVFVGNIGIKPATSYILNRWGFRRVLLAACATLAASMACAAFLTGGTPIVLIVVVAVVSGVARSVGGTSYNTLSFCDVPEAQMAHANTLSATAQQLAAGLGVAAATLALRLGGALGSQLGPGTRPTSYSIAFLLLALLPLAAILGVTRLHRDAGNAARNLPAPAGEPAEIGGVAS